MKGALCLLLAMAMSAQARAELAVVALSDEQRLDDGAQVTERDGGQQMAVVRVEHQDVLADAEGINLFAVGRKAE